MLDLARSEVIEILAVLVMGIGVNTIALWLATGILFFKKRSVWRALIIAAITAISFLAINFLVYSAFDPAASEEAEMPDPDEISNIIVKTTIVMFFALALGFIADLIVTTALVHKFYGVGWIRSFLAWLVKFLIALVLGAMLWFLLFAAVYLIEIIG
ncbi:MAG: hypothetical protein A7316_06115 [Candidatus Altiarchaeales archaeon WOR_SM1_86-2]|nr:MAG: hypothetical protein A7316_06115 [Candidatus Altiarchaeales archaeon WOR_SM1_86-2]ODS41378.1 MAG: hypothetical protein A7315_06475 [Candidatus Altiarchaeales archaeon WOR_SM1_79]